MAVVIDSTMLACLVSGDERAGRVSRQFAHWLKDGEALHAPSLCCFEFADFLTRLVAEGRLPRERVSEVWSHLGSLPIEYHVLSDVPRVVSIATDLGDKRAFDAAYLALGERLDAPLWTLNRRIRRRRGAAPIDMASGKG
jgi:predicted nucleic acid-binding protein